MGYVTREMIDRAKKMDLLTYLQTYEPQELVHFGGNTYCTREHDSLKISNGKWYWFSRGIGGKTALDYLIKVKELPFTEAVERIVGRAAERPSVFHARAQPEKPKTLLLPPKSNSNTRVIAYLKSRSIDGGLIEQCIRSGQLYESLPHHNAVFVGMDRNGTLRYACLRGIGTDFKGEATGSDKRFSFALPATGESRMLCVFESAIDLLSYATMAQAGGLSWRSQHLLSLAGVYKPQKETQEHRLPLALTQYADLTETEIERRSSHPAESLEDTVVRQILNEELHKAIAQLPDTQRRRLVLYYFQQLTYEQIAEMEGCRYQSVQESILSAIEKLRKYFK